MRAADLAAADAMAAANALAPLSRNTPGYAKKDGASFRLNYVGFPTSTTATHARHVLSKHALEIALLAADDDDDDENVRRALASAPVL